MTVQTHTLPDIKWQPTKAKGERHGSKVQRVVLHRWGVKFTDRPHERMSYHGVINEFREQGKPGVRPLRVPGSAVPNEITQMVRYADYAWTEAAYNPTSVEIECADAIWLGHDQRRPRAAGPHHGLPAAPLRAAAGLVARPRLLPARRPGCGGWRSPRVPDDQHRVLEGVRSEDASALPRRRLQKGVGRMNFNDRAPWMTIAILVIAIIIVIVGGVAVITGHLTFETYLNDLEKFSIGVGLVAVGRGIHKSGARIGR
jgi:hypothetical protein